MARGRPVQRLVEVVPPGQAAGRARAHLVEEPLLDERRQGVAGRLLGRGLRVQGGGELGLDHGQAGRGEPAERLAGVLEGDREVAGVQADADVLARAGADALGGVGGRLHDAAGLGLEPDPQRAAGVGGHLGQAVLEPGEVALGRLLPVRQPRAAPAERQRGDAAPGDVVGQQPGQHRRAVQRVVQPVPGGPVRPVDGLLDHRGVEAAPRERVDRHDLDAGADEPGAQPLQRGGLGDQARGERGGQPQADADEVDLEPAAQPVADGRQLGEDVVEVLGGVDVAAVGEVDGGPVAVGEPHARAPAAASCPRRSRRRRPAARRGRAGRSGSRTRPGCATGPCRRRRR